MNWTVELSGGQVLEFQPPDYPRTREWSAADMAEGIQNWLPTLAGLTDQPKVDYPPCSNLEKWVSYPEHYHVELPDPEPEPFDDIPF